MMFNLDLIREPKLLFGYNQKLEDPKDGLTLFGPLEEPKVYGVRVGVIGSKEGIRRFEEWAERVQGPIIPENIDVARFVFPGFKAVFGINWDPRPSLRLVIPDADFKTIYIDDRYQRVFGTVSLYADRIVKAIREEETKVDVWFVVIPDEVHKYCRPRSFVEATLRIKAEVKLTKVKAARFRVVPSFFEEDNKAIIPYTFEVDFHNQLKARLLKSEAIIQIIKESTLAPHELWSDRKKAMRDVTRFEAEVAWNVSTALYYKAGGRPWKIANIRKGVCYLGLVFKQDDRDTDPRTACCAAQMFLDSGDGIVFKGAIGPWYNPERSNYHLSAAAAKELVTLAVESYRDNDPEGKHPHELFIHGRVHLWDKEWEGFLDGTDPSTNVVGVRIRDRGRLKLFRPTDYPVLRGLSFENDSDSAYLWTRGHIPRLQTYPGREVPNPLFVEISRGEADIRTVLEDIMALTKLNYNTSNFADGRPVTLRFADAVGEILTAAPLSREEAPPLPFRHYI